MINKVFLYPYYLANVLILTLDQIFNPKDEYFQFRIITISLNICFIVFQYFRTLTLKNTIILVTFIKINQMFSTFLFQHYNTYFLIAEEYIILKSFPSIKQKLFYLALCFASSSALIIINYQEQPLNLALSLISLMVSLLLRGPALPKLTINKLQQMSFFQSQYNYLPLTSTPKDTPAHDSYESTNLFPIGVAFVNQQGEIIFKNNFLIQFLDENETQLEAIDFHILKQKKLNFSWDQMSNGGSLGKIIGKATMQLNELIEYFNKMQKSIFAQAVIDRVTIALTILSYSSNTIALIIQDITSHRELLDNEIKEKFKSKVINSFSHELRTPLNGAMLYLSTALQACPKLAEYVNPALNALKLQQYLINDIVDFCSLSEGIFELKLGQVDIQEIINEMKNLFNNMFKLKKLTFSVDVDERVSNMIKTDFQRVCQVMVNVLMNAVKYSTGPGKVMLLIKRIGEYQVQFRVNDQGLGIEQKKLKQLKRMLQANHLARKVTSIDNWNGFGLIISQMILLNLSGGKLTIDSAGPNQGSSVAFNVTNLLSSTFMKQSVRPTFSKYCTAPCFQEVPKEEQVYLNDDEVQEKKVRQYNLEVNGTITSLNIKHERRSKCQCRRLLSVDDEVFNQHSLKMLLKQFNYEVETVYNGKQAIELIEKSQLCCEECKYFKAILMDCQMPVLDGWETTRILKEMMKDERIPEYTIIGLTAFTTKPDIDRCFEVGMDYILHKPLNVKKLQDILQNE